MTTSNAISTTTTSSRRSDRRVSMMSASVLAVSATTASFRPSASTCSLSSYSSSMLPLFPGPGGARDEFYARHVAEGGIANRATFAKWTVRPAFYCRRRWMSGFRSGIWRVLLWCRQRPLPFQLKAKFCRPAIDRTAFSTWSECWANITRRRPQGAYAPDRDYRYIETSRTAARTGSIVCLTMYLSRPRCSLKVIGSQR